MERVQLDGYIRVSDVRGRSGETFISPDVQAEKINRYAELHGHQIVKMWVELDQSGGTVNRPYFQEAVGRVERGETGGMIVAKLDRFARTLAGALEAVKRIEAAGGQLVSVEDHFDTSTPIGKFGFQIMLALAELEYGRIRDNWRLASAHAVARGVHATPRLPCGYDRGEDGRLIPNTDAPRITEAFRQRAAGRSSTRIAEELNEAGVRTSYGGVWIGQTVRAILKNRVYLGEARGQAGAVLEGAHPAIVDEPTFLAATTSRDVTIRTSSSLLSGLLRCAGCRYAMSRGFNKNQPSSERYRCRVEYTTGRCPHPTAVHPHVIEDYVVEQLFEGGTPVMHLTSEQPDFDAARAALARAETEMESFRDAESAITDLGTSVYLDGLEARVEARDAAHQAFTDLFQASQAADAINEVVKLRDEWIRLDVTDQQELLASAIDVIFLRRGRGIPISDRALILWRGQGPTDLPRRAKPQPLRGFAFPGDGHVAIGEPPPADLAVRRSKRTPRLSR